MKRKIYYLLVLTAFLYPVFKTQAQNTLPATAPRVAVFSPLFLDSCFDAKGTYKYGKLVPKFAIPGVEYYFGATMAVDSLKKEGQQLHIKYFDSRSMGMPVQRIIQSGALDSMDMLIGSVAMNDARLLADYAKQKNIPFISGTLPNDAGITNNPNVVILNSTLRTHCENLYHYLQKNQANRKIVLLTRPGRLEERITGYFKEFEKNTSGNMLAIKTVNLGNAFVSDSLLNFIDTSVFATYIVGTTDANFAIAVAKGLTDYGQQSNSILVGMPTWEDIAEFSKPAYKDLNIYYPVPMVTPTTQKPAVTAAAKFKAKFGSIPGENMYRGYENVYHFCKLLVKYGKDTPANFTDKNYMIFSSYSLQPVMTTTNPMTLDYFENKKIWIINKFNGINRTIAFP